MRSRRGGPTPRVAEPSPIGWRRGRAARGHVVMLWLHQTGAGRCWGARPGQRGCEGDTATPGCWTGRRWPWDGVSEGMGRGKVVLTPLTGKQSVRLSTSLAEQCFGELFLFPYSTDVLNLTVFVHHSCA